ncbi:MAG: thioesterase family protein [Acidimicrobiales bacterium]
MSDETVQAEPAGQGAAVRYPFSEVTAVVPAGPGRFDAFLNTEWTIGNKPNGGYLLGVLGRAASCATSHPHVITATGQYVRAPEPGPVVVWTEVIREGRSASQVRAQLLQNDKVCVESLITVSRLERGGKVFWDGGVPAIEDVPFDRCIPLVGLLPNGARVAIMEQIDIRLDPATTGFTRGEPSGLGELRGWLALSHDESFDPVSLLFAGDAFPPATFEIEFVGWVPTLAMTVFVRALPEPGPVRVLQRAQLIDAQRVDESCFIWDRTGRLVAEAHQLAGIRLG